jgi:hypothetical protein
MEAEYVALTKAAKKCVHLRLLLSELGFAQTEPSVAFEDNRSAINLALAPEITKNSKHIHVRHHYIRDLVRSRAIRIQYLPTSDMTADLLTKPLATKAFLYFRNKLLNSSEKLVPTVVAGVSRTSLPSAPSRRRSSLRGEC